MYPFSISFFLELVLEWLPISSSGHILFLSTLSSKIIPLDFFQSNLAHAFILLPQLLFIFPYILNLYRQYNIKKLLYIGSILGLITFITCLSFLFKKFFLFNVLSLIPLSFGFFITTLSLFYLSKKKYQEKNITNIIWKEAIFLGLVQSVTLIPGISRFAVTLAFLTKLGYKQEDTLFISLLLNIAISFISLSYIIFTVYSDPLSIKFQEMPIIKLLLNLFFGSFLFLIFKYIFFKKKIHYIVLYECTLSLISLYSAHINYI